MKSESPPKSIITRGNHLISPLAILSSAEWEETGIAACTKKTEVAATTVIKEKLTTPWKGPEEVTMRRQKLKKFIILL